MSDIKKLNGYIINKMKKNGEKYPVEKAKGKDDFGKLPDQSLFFHAAFFIFQSATARTGIIAADFF